MSEDVLLGSWFSNACSFYEQAFFFIYGNMCSNNLNFILGYDNIPSELIDKYTGGCEEQKNMGLLYELYEP